MTDDTKALVARLRTSHGQIVHEFYSKDGKLYCDCAICDAADLIERQGNALRAVAELCEKPDHYGEGIEYGHVFVDACKIRAALAQTEPQPADGEPYVSLTGTALQRFKENPLRDDKHE